jgi:hypothetical protein
MLPPKRDTLTRNLKVVENNGKKNTEKKKDEVVPTSPSYYKSLKNQNVSNIGKMTDEDAKSGKWDKPGYELDLSRSYKGESSPGNFQYQPVYKKISTPSGKKPEPIQRTEIGKLPTKKATQVGPPNVAPMRVKKDYVINTPAKKEEKFVPTAKTKKLTKGGKSVVGSNIATSVKNIVGKAKFEREKKQAEAGKRGLRGTGESGSTGRERLQALKDQKKNLKDARRTTGVSVKKELKDVRQGIKYERKSLRGRTTYRG